MKEVLKKVYDAIPLKKQLFETVRFFGVPPYSVYKHLHFTGIIKLKAADCNLSSTPSIHRFLIAKKFALRSESVKISAGTCQLEFLYIDGVKKPAAVVLSHVVEASSPMDDNILRVNSTSLLTSYPAYLSC